jgi:hypothetical protein
MARNTDERAEAGRSRGPLDRLRNHLPKLRQPDCKADEKLSLLERRLNARVLLEPQAGVLLSRFPDSALTRIFDVVADWGATTRILWVRVAAIPEPDDPSWEEVALKIAIDEENDVAIQRWKALSRSIAMVKSQLDEKTRSFLDRNLRVHVLSGAMAEAAWRALADG